MFLALASWLIFSCECTCPPTSASLNCRSNDQLSPCECMSFSPFLLRSSSLANAPACHPSLPRFSPYVLLPIGFSRHRTSASLSHFLALKHVLSMKSHAFPPSPVPHHVLPCSSLSPPASRPTAAHAVARSHYQRPTLRHMSFVCLCASNRTSASPNGRTNVCLFGSL